MLSAYRIYTLLLTMTACLSLLGSYLFPFHLLPLTTFYNEWLFALFLGLALAWVLLEQGKLFISNPIQWAALAVALVLHAWFTQSYTEAQWGLMALFGLYAGLAWLAYALGQNLQGQSIRNVFMACVAGAALVSAMVAVLQWTGMVADQGWDPAFILYSEGGGRVSSNIGQANNLGTLLVIGMGVIAYAWYGATQQRTTTWKVLAVLALLLLVFGVYVSGSRTAVLNLMLWPVLLGAWALWQRKAFPWLAVLPIGTWLVLQWVMPAVIEWWGLFPVQEARSMVQDQNRFRLWHMVLTAIAESPWTGHGFGAVANAHLRLSPEFGAFDYRIAQHAHNTVLDLWAMFGLPLGTLVVGGVTWLWAKAWWRSAEVSQQFMWLMCTAMLVHAMLEYPLHYGFFLWLLFMLLGVLAGEPRLTIRFKRPAQVSVVWLGAFALLAIPVWLGYVQVEKLYTQYRQRGGEAVQRALLQREAGWTDPLFAEPYERLYWLSKPVDEVLKLPAEELQRLELQASIYPLPGLGWRVAMAHAAQGRPTEAKWWAHRMCAMFSPQVCESGMEALANVKPDTQ